MSAGHFVRTLRTLCPDTLQKLCPDKLRLPCPGYSTWLLQIPQSKGDSAPDTLSGQNCRVSGQTRGSIYRPPVRLSVRCERNGALRWKTG